MVNSYTWFILDGRKGMHGMSLEEKAVYRDLLDLIYQKNAQVPDDDAFIAKWVGCDVRIYRRIKAALIAKGRVYVENGLICDQKAQERLAKEVARATSQRQNSLLGGLATKAKHQPFLMNSKPYASPTASPAPEAQRLAPLSLSKKESFLPSSLTPSERDGRATALPTGAPARPLPDRLIHELTAAEVMQCRKKAATEVVVG